LQFVRNLNSQKTWQNFWDGVLVRNPSPNHIWPGASGLYLWS